MGKKENINKVVLAYSGGLDTSVILKWLQETYDCEVVTFSADLGQGAELEEAKKKAEDLGVKEIFIEDLKNEFVKDYVFPMFRANTIYEGSYLLGTAIARPLIAKKQIEIAKEVGADAVCHGATGKGNDQIRFELAYYGLNPNIKVIAPWREWDLNSRKKLIEFAEKNQIVITKDNLGEDYIHHLRVNYLRTHQKNVRKMFIKELFRQKTRQIKQHILKSNSKKATLYLLMEKNYHQKNY